jgi:microcystin degradation protein MlrC
MVSNSTAIVFYQTNPHVDQRQRGLDAASIMVRTVNGNVQPTQAFAKPSTLISIACQNTSFDPLQSFMKQARSIEQTAGVLSASISAGFPYADVYEIGPSVLVVTDNDQASAQRQADDLAGKLFDARKTLVAQLPNACDAVARAMRAAKRPVVLVEFGDNIGGGSPGDSTIILEELLRQGASGTVCVLYDPESARQAAQAGAGGVIKLTVGGKSDNLHGRPIPLTCRVCSIHDGKWTEEQPRHGGRRFNDQGQTVVLEVAKADIASGATAPPSHEALTSTRGSLIVLNSKRTPPFSLGQLTSLGIDPVRMHAIVVKAAIAYRAAYGSIAGEIIEVDTPGLTANDPRHFHYARARRPLYPIDEL